MNAVVVVYSVEKEGYHLGLHAWPVVPILPVDNVGNICHCSRT